MFNRIFWGIVLICLGALFILDQRDIVQFDLGYIISTYWPIILIYFGLKGLFFQYKWGHGMGFGYLYPIILTTIGVYFLGRNIDYIEMSAGDFFQYVIPFILILIGVIIILRPGRKKTDQADSRADGWQDDHIPYHDSDASEQHAETTDWSRYGAADTQPYEHSREPEEETAPRYDEHTRSSHDPSAQQKVKAENHFSFIGDTHIGSANWSLKPLNVNHFIGDTVIDLTRASIPDGLTKITVGSLIGDVKVMLPRDADVEASVTMSSFIGEFYIYGKRESGMMKNYREESPHYPLARKKIQIMVNMFIGDFRLERV